MGYNPLRRYRGGRALDIAILVAIPVIIIALAFWAMR
jgi:hypothetical protein